MKKLLKRFLTPNQLNNLIKLREGLNNFAAHLILKFLRILPIRLRSSIKQNFNIVKVLDYPSQKIVLDIDSQIETYSRLKSCGKEPETVRWIETFLKEGEVLFDIGANVGAYSLVASKSKKGNITIYAFEPSYPNFYKLCKNVCLNKCQTSIVPLNLALSNVTQLGELTYSSLLSGAALHSFDKKSNFSTQVSPLSYRQTTMSMRIDDLIEMFDVKVPNHLKLDVDGIELSILQGASRTLQKSSVKSILVELEPKSETSTNIIELLRSNGFDIYSSHKHGLDDTSTHNYVFIRINDPKIDIKDFFPRDT